MPSVIKYQTYSGGSGLGDPQILIGYCEESPVEVLEKVFKTHFIYRYRDTYRPIDYNYPNNVLGLVINEIKEDVLDSMGIAKLKSVDSLDLDIAKEKELKRDIRTFEHALDNARRWHCQTELEISEAEELVKKNSKYEVVFKEIEGVVF